MKHIIINSDIFRHKLISSLAVVFFSLTVFSNLSKKETFSLSCTVWFQVVTELGFGLCSNVFLFCSPKSKDAMFGHCYRSRQQKRPIVPSCNFRKSIFPRQQVSSSNTSLQISESLGGFFARFIAFCGTQHQPHTSTEQLHQIPNINIEWCLDLSGV